DANRTLAHADHIALDAVAVLEFLTGDLLGGQQDAILAVIFGAELDHDDATFGGPGISLDEAGHDGALVVCVGVEGALGLSLTQASHDGVTHRAGGDTSEVGRRVIVFGGDGTLIVEFGDDHGNGTGGDIN